jgi:hypothetical protein
MQLLEGRRLAIEASMWQAPTLTIVGQAFILGVLTNRRVGLPVALLVASAGVLVSFATALALWQQRDRETLFSERIKDHASGLGWPDPRRQHLGRSRGAWHPLEWPGWKIWIAPVVLFGVADILALILTDRV